MSPLYLCVFKSNETNEPYASFSHGPEWRYEEILAQFDFSGNLTIEAISVMIELARETHSEYRPIEELLNKLFQLGIEIGKKSQTP